MESSTSKKRTICFVAVGTRGDIQPVLVLCKQILLLGHTSPRPHLQLIIEPKSKAFCTSWLDEALTSVPLLRSHVQVVAGWCLPREVDSGHREAAKPARKDDTPDSGAADAASSNTSSSPSGPLPTMLLDSCRGCCALVISLFSLEAHAVAEALSIPVLVHSPFVPQRTAPHGFERELSKHHPDLVEALSTAAASPPSTKRVKQSATENVTMKHVQFWMWRLFLDDIGDFRHQLGLPSTPFYQFARASHTERPIVSLTRAPPLLISVSHHLFSAEPFWPDNVEMVGFCHDLTKSSTQETAVLHASDTTSRQQDSHRTRLATLQSILLSRNVESVGGAAIEYTSLQREHNFSGSSVFVCFGSMDQLAGLTERIDVDVLLTTLLERYENVIVQARDQLAERVRSFSKALPKRQSLFLCPGDDLPHMLLFPLCDVIVHHGGAGTVATSLLCASSQVIIPLQFDQSRWADTLAWQGLAPSPCRPEAMTQARLAAMLRQAQSSATKQRIVQVSRLMREESSAWTGAKRILEYFDRVSEFK